MKIIPYYVALKKTAFAAFFLLIAAWAQVLSAQTVSGKVTDSSTGEALIGATITEDGQSAPFPAMEDLNSQIPPTKKSSFISRIMPTQA